MQKLASAGTLVLLVWILGSVISVKLPEHVPTDDVLFSREVLSYQVLDGAGVDALVQYEYVSEPLPELLDLREIPEKRTESSYTRLVGHENGEPVNQLVAYPQRQFIEYAGVWRQRDVAYTTLGALAAKQRGNPIASLFWERAHADTATSFASAGDGHISDSDADDGSLGTGINPYCQNYSAVYSSPGSVADYTSALGSVGTFFFTSGPNSSCDMVYAYLPFDTSSIPSGSSITAATVHIYVSAKSNSDNDGNDYVYAVETFQASNTILSDTDQDLFGGIQGSDSIDITSISTGAYTTFTLDATGRGWVKRSGETSSCGGTPGYTCIGLIERHTVLGDQASGAGNRLDWYASERTGTAEDPYITVTYTPPVGESGRRLRLFEGFSLKLLNGRLIVY